MSFSKLMQGLKSPKAIRELEARGLISAEEAAQREAALLPVATREEAEIVQDVAGGMGQSGRDELQNAQDLYQQRLPTVIEPQKPNFTMGENYIPDSFLVPAPTPGFPEIQGTAGPSANTPPSTSLQRINRPDTIDAEFRNIPDQTQGKPGFTPAQWAKLGAGIGVAGAGAYMLGGNEQLPLSPMAAPPAAPPVEQPLPIAPTQESPEVEALKKQLAMLSASQEPVNNKLMDIDFGDNASGSREELQRLQDARNQNVFYNQLGKSFNQIGGAISGADRNTIDSGGRLFDDNIKLAEQPISDYKARIDMEKDDPNSAASQGLRQVFKRMGMNVKGAASYNDLQRLSPTVANLYSASEARIARSKDRELALKMSQETKTAAREEKADTKKSEKTQSFRKELTTGVLGKQYQSFLTSNRMIDSFKEFNKNPSGYSDYATLMGGLKSLQGDESVVREAEIRLGTNATSFFNKINNYVQSAATGRSLQPSQRKEIQRAVSILREASQASFLNAAQPMMAQAEQEGIDLKYILPENLLEKTKGGLPKDKKDLPKSLQKPPVGTPLKAEEVDSYVDSLSDAQIAEELKKRKNILPN